MFTTQNIGSGNPFFNKEISANWTQVLVLDEYRIIVAQFYGQWAKRNAQNFINLLNKKAEEFSSQEIAKKA
jgi:hypothetical protein